MNYLRSAIHNEAKADETADMLRAARMLLATSMFFLFFVVGLMMAYGADPKMPREVDVQLKAINHNLLKMDSSLVSKNNINIDDQKQRIDSLSIQLQELKQEMKKHFLVRPKIGLHMKSK